MFTLKSGKKVDLSKIKCRHCGKKGHFQFMKDKCPKADGRQDRSENEEDGTETSIVHCND